MNPVRRIIIGAAALAGAVGLVALGAGAVQAAAPETKTVVWAVPAGLGDRFAEPQYLAADTSACGQYQVDTYDYSSRADRVVVDGLLARGTLTSATDDGPVYQSGHDVVTSSCTAAGKSGPKAITLAAGDPGATSGGTGSSAGDLAFTGTNGTLLELAAGGAVVLIGAGVVLTGVRRHSRREG